MSLQASSMGLLHQQPALAQQHNNEIQSFFSRLLERTSRRHPPPFAIDARWNNNTVTEGSSAAAGNDGGLGAGLPN